MQRPVLFPTDLDDIASRLDARLTIASHGASSDAEPSPTKAPTRTSQHQSTGTQKAPLTCMVPGHTHSVSQDMRIA